MQIKYSFFCDAANIDTTGKVNALGIFNNINSENFPLIYPKMTFVAGIEGRRSEAGQHHMKIKFIDEDGKDIIPPMENVIESSVSKPNTNLLFDLVGINFHNPGVYSLDIIMDNQLLRSESISVFKVQK